MVESIVPIPKHILTLHKNVFLTVDLFYVNKIVFLITHSRGICLTTVKWLDNRKIAGVFAALCEVFTAYQKRGFLITTVHGDNEFAPLLPFFNKMTQPPKLILAAKGDHVPEIERRIRVVKERCRAIRHSLPFNKLPLIITMYMVLHAVRMLNFFPQKAGVSDTLSPKMIISGERLDWKRHLALPFGSYCQVHEQDENGRSDINNERTLGAICLGPSDNQNSGYRFMSLLTGRKVTRTSWTELPMPRQVIERVHSLAADQPEQLVFYDRHGRDIGDNSTSVGIDDRDAQIQNDQDTTTVARQLGESLLEQDFVLEDEEMSLPNTASIMDNDDVQGQEEPTARTNGMDIDESNRAPQTVESYEESEPVSDNRTEAGHAPPLPRRSARLRTNTQHYQPSMSGKKYGYVTTVLEPTVHPDAHIWNDNSTEISQQVFAAIQKKNCEIFF